ncbi:MAG TPA: addiction module protein [Planctomycetota bacterium]|nr:addiction module protein [Planctomycetota bacterium]
MHTMGLPRIDLTSLTDAERLQLLDEVWESFREAPDSLPLTDAQRTELERRQTAYDAGQMFARPWQEVREEIRSQLRAQR